MARIARAAARVAIDPHAALGLWTDVARWPSFVEGFARIVEGPDPAWPAPGSRIAWETRPSGRGRVSEKVLESMPGEFVTSVAEERLHGTQTFLASAEPEGTRVELILDYELARSDPLGALADLLFVRRALRDALVRTLRRFAVEAEEDAGLR